MADERLVSSLPSRFTVIDPTQLGKMAVLEDLDSENIRSDRLVKFKEVWTEHDPPAGAEYDVDTLEFDPIVINTEACTYFELLLRDRVNQAARSVTLAFAISTDLDAIASRYPGGVPRLKWDASGTLLTDADVTAGATVATYESDDAYRRRIWLSPDILSPHGTPESYIFWAMSSDGTYRDAGALAQRDSKDCPTGVINIPVLLDDKDETPWEKEVGTNKNNWTRTLTFDPLPTLSQRLATRTYISNAGRKGLTDVVHVVEPKVKHIDYDIDIYTFPNATYTTVMSDIRDALDDMVENKRWLGQDHMLDDIIKACKQDGVYTVKLTSPTADTVVGFDGFVQVDSMRIAYKGTGE